MTTILLHTIALEPARWLPERVSRNLVEMLPPIAAAGFQQLEVFEPHIRFAPDRRALKAVMEEHGLEPVILSSYLQLNPERADDNDVAHSAAELLEMVREFGFRKVRLFPGVGVKPSNGRAVAEVVDRIGRVANLLPDIQILLETHDNSPADDPACMVEMVDALQMENVGLLWQPTVFDDAEAQAQWELQAPYVKHIHLQNRRADGAFCRLSDGLVRWPRILLDAKCSASIEFVPTGIRSPDTFDFTMSLEEAAAEADWAEAARV